MVKNRKKDWVLALRIQEQKKEVARKTENFSWFFLLHPETNGEANLTIARTRIGFNADTFPYYTWQKCEFKYNPQSFEYTLTNAGGVQFTELDNEAVLAFYAMDMHIGMDVLGKIKFYNDLLKNLPKNVFIPAAPFVAVAYGYLKEHKTIPQFSADEWNEILQNII